MLSPNEDPLRVKSESESYEEHSNEMEDEDKVMFLDRVWSCRKNALKEEQDRKKEKKRRKRNFLRLINKMVPRPCPQCGREFSREDGLTRHIASTHEGQVFKCNFCSTCFKEKRYIVKHLARNHPSENRDGWMKTKIEQVQQKKPKSNQFTQLPQSKYCPNCGKHFEKDLGRHIRFVHGEKNLSCEHCDAKFGREDNLQRHIKAVHLREQFQCDFCQFRGAEKRTVVEHAKRAHNLKGLPKMKFEKVIGEQQLSKRSRSMSNNDAILQRFKSLLDL